MEGITKSLSIALAVLTTVLVLSLAVYTMQMGRAAYSKQHERSAETLSKVAAPYWQRYANPTLLGSNVHYLVSKSDAFYRVITKENTTSFSTFMEIKDPKSIYYVDPADKFISRVIYNQHDVVVGLCFMEIGARSGSNDSRLLADLETTKEDLVVQLSELRDGGD